MTRITVIIGIIGGGIAVLLLNIAMTPDTAAITVVGLAAIAGAGYIVSTQNK